MTEIDIEITTGKLRALPVVAQSSDTLILNGPCKLCGFSLRDVSGEQTADIQNQVVSPGALVTIATTGALSAGTYDVAWTVELIGAAAAADANNFRLVAGGANVELSQNAGAAGSYAQVTARVTVPVFGTILVQAVAAGTVGVTYSVQFEVIPAAIQLSVAELQDGNNALAEIACVNGGTDRAWYSEEGIEVYNRINFHPLVGSFTGAIYVRFYRSGD